MTRPRTIHRRNARKRAKRRPRSPSIRFTTADWMMREELDRLTRRLQVADVMNRRYK